MVRRRWRVLPRWTYPTLACLLLSDACVPRQASLRVRDQIGEVDELGVVERLDHFRHRGVIARARIGLVLAQCLEQVILSLRRQPGYIIVPGEIQVVTEDAMMLAG